MADVTEVEAVTIDPLATVTPAETWLAECSGKVESIAKDYAIYEIHDAEDYRQMKRDRAALRKKLAAIDAERKGMTAEVDRAVREFRDGAKAVLAPLADIDAAYAERVHAFEDQCAYERMEKLRAIYCEQCENVATVVDFDTVAAKWAKADKWTSASVTEQAAVESLYAHCYEITEGEERIIRAPYESPEEREAARSYYFETLDVGGTFEWVQERREAMARVAELDAMRNWRPETPEEPETVVYRVEVPRQRVREFVEAMKALGDVHGRRWEQ